MYPYNYGGYGMMGGFGIFDFIGHILLVVLVIWSVVWVLRAFGMGRRGRVGMWHAHSALNILNERFAKGEIDQKEYEERKKALLGQ
jgi:putative membrane protein